MGRSLRGAGLQGALLLALASRWTATIGKHPKSECSIEETHVGRFDRSEVLAASALLLVMTFATLAARMAATQDDNPSAGRIKFT